MPYTPLRPAVLSFDAYGTPVSVEYDDVYHTATGGLSQARHVFLAGNQLPQRWQSRERFVILETGFGLGLNFLATWAAWRSDPKRCGRLHFLSVEKHPFSAQDLRLAQDAWPEFAELAAELRAQWPLLLPGLHRIELDGGQIILTLGFGEAEPMLRRLEASVDAIYLDGFSPAKNPDLWSPQVFRAVARLAAPGATVATWSVAARVREGLAAVEFAVEKRAGFLGKRDMLVGHYVSRKPLRHTPPTVRRAIVLGAGIAGCTVAERLAARGWQVEVIERNAAPAQGASGNLAGVLRPHPSVDDNPISRLTRAGFLATVKLLKRLGSGVNWQACGALRLASLAEYEALQRRTVAGLEQPEEYLQFLEADAASALLQRPVPFGGWLFPGGGWVQPTTLCRSALAAWPEQIRLHTDTAVAHIATSEEGWQCLDAHDKIIASAPHLIVAGGIEATRLAPLAWLPQSAGRGQLTYLEAASRPALELVVSGHGYITPAVGGMLCLGATHADDLDPEERINDHQANIEKIARLLPGFFAEGEAKPATLHGRVGFRPLSPDRLPMVGPVPIVTGEHPPSRHPPVHPGLWCAQGYGARGIVWSALMAELLACQIEGEPLPLESDLVRAVAPARFR